MLNEIAIDHRDGSSVERTKKDIQSVVDFIDQHLSKTSIVYQKVLEATNQITINLLTTSAGTTDSLVATAMDRSCSNDTEDNSNTNMEVDAKLTNELLTLKVHLIYSNYCAVLSSNSTSIIDLQVLPSESIQGLCKKVEDVVFGRFRSRVIVERVSNRRTSRAWSNSSIKCLQECDIGHLDEITVDCRSCSIDVVELSPVIDPFLQRLNQFNTIPCTPLELLSLALHSLMIDEQFIPVVELPNTVAGFAPSIKGQFVNHHIHSHSSIYFNYTVTRLLSTYCIFEVHNESISSPATLVTYLSTAYIELPKGSFIPSDWNKDRFAAGFMYKHKLMPGKHFVLALVGR